MKANSPDRIRLLIGHRIQIERHSGAKYGGVLLSYQEKRNRICVGSLLIINQQGGLTASKDKRWFNIDSIAFEKEQTSLI